MITESIKAAQLTRRGVSASPNPDGKAANFKENTVSNGAGRFLRLKVCTYRVWSEKFSCGSGRAASWAPLMLYLLAASPAEEGIWSALLVPPSIRRRPSPNPPVPFSAPGVHRAGVLSILGLICSFSTSPQPPNTKIAAQKTVRSGRCRQKCVDFTCGFIVTEAIFKFSLFICLFLSPTQPKVCWGKIAGKRQEKITQRRRVMVWLADLPVMLSAGKISLHACVSHHDCLNTQWTNTGFFFF